MTDIFYHKTSRIIYIIIHCILYRWILEVYCNCLILAKFERYLVVLLMQVIYIRIYGAQARNTKNRCLDILIDSFFVLQVVGTIVAYQASDKQERAKASIPAIGFNKPIDQLSDCCRGESWAMLERVTQLTRTRSIVECGKGG